MVAKTRKRKRSADDDTKTANSTDKRVKTNADDEAKPHADERAETADDDEAKTATDNDAKLDVANHTWAGYLDLPAEMRTLVMQECFSKQYFTYFQGQGLAPRYVRRFVKLRSLALPWPILEDLAPEDEIDPSYLNLLLVNRFVSDEVKDYIKRNKTGILVYGRMAPLMQLGHRWFDDAITRIAVRDFGSIPGWFVTQLPALKTIFTGLRELHVHRQIPMAANFGVHTPYFNVRDALLRRRDQTLIGFLANNNTHGNDAHMITEILIVYGQQNVSHIYSPWSFVSHEARAWLRQVDGELELHYRLDSNGFTITKMGIWSNVRNTFYSAQEALAAASW